jgi:enterochelin esterase-like enzyme
MRYNFLLLLVVLVTSSAGAQSEMSLNDSVSRRIAANSAESVFVSLRDADYVKLVATHPSGLAMSVIRPNGESLRPFVTSAMKGAHEIEFVAEGAGRYALAVKNETNSALQYDLAFRERLSLDERTPVLPRRDAVPSPKIEAMRQQIESGNTNTTEFWNVAAKEGTPLVEPLDPRYDIVTFLWRAQGDTRNVFLNPSFRIPRWELPDYPLNHLGKSDIWYLTVPLPKGARFTYQLEPNRPTIDTMPQITSQADPLNHNVKFDCPAGATKYRCESIAELPEAPPQPWIGKRAGVATGKIEKQKIHSALQNVDRDLTIYTTDGYSAKGKPAALLFMFDGDMWLEDTWHGRDVWDNLVAADKVPPMVVVMVHNLPGRRLFDLVANPTFGNFMAKELVPWVRSHYNVSHDPEKTVVSGASAGGFGAAYLGLLHPEVFGNVLSMSGAFWWSPEHNGGICAGNCASPSSTPAIINQDGTTEPNLVAKIALEQPASRTKFYLAAGTFEFDRFGTAGQILEETRHLRDILRAKKMNVIYHQFVGGHDGVSRPSELAEGLQRLLRQ